jgi:hypothetical protein
MAAAQPCPGTSKAGLAQYRSVPCTIMGLWARPFDVPSFPGNQGLGHFSSFLVPFRPVVHGSGLMRHCFPSLSLGQSCLALSPSVYLLPCVTSKQNQSSKKSLVTADPVNTNTCKYSKVLKREPKQKQSTTPLSKI